MRNIVIATSRAWNEWIAKDLIQDLGDTVNVYLITKASELTKKNLEDMKVDIVFFPHWSSIIPKVIYENYLCVIFHMTNLPYGRGGSPLQNLIEKGHSDTTISAIRCVENLDAGPVYLKSPLSLDGSATEIFTRMSIVIKKMIVQFIKHKPKSVDQKGKIVEFKRRSPSESNILDVKDTMKAFDHIRMLDADGYPRAFFETKYLKFEMSNTEYLEGELYARVKIVSK